MIKIKASLRGLPFSIDISGKIVTYTGMNQSGNIERTQWFPPLTPKVMMNIDPVEYAEWKTAKDEQEVYNLIKMDLMKNECKIISEEIKSN